MVQPSHAAAVVFGIVLINAHTLTITASESLLNSAQDDASVLWDGGGVVLFSDYSYTSGDGSVGGVQLLSGGYELACGSLTPTGHTKLSSEKAFQYNANLNGWTSSMKLGAASGITVHLVATNGSCNGTRIDATFTAYAGTPSITSGFILFTTTFVNGYNFSTASLQTQQKCNIEQNIDFHGNDLRYVDNITDIDQCCELCQNDTLCVAFTMMGAADKDKPWADRCYLKNSASNKEPYATHISGIVRPNPPSPPDSPSGLLTSFPAFSNALSDSIGYLTWSGEFFPAKWGIGGSGPGTGSPITVFDSENKSGVATVISTFDEHFTSECALTKSMLGCGVSIQVQSIAPGYSTAIMLVPGCGGVTNSVMSWGRTLQVAHNTSRTMATQDIVTTKLGYWTDNMAYYDWYHWFPNVTRDGTPQDIIMQLNEELINKNIHVAYYQLDAYWYKLEIAPGYCVVDWHAVSDQFPNGLKWLTQQIKVPLLLYTDTWCNDTIYRKEQGGKFTFMDGDIASLSWFKGATANVIPEESLQFYREIMAVGIQQGLGAFEVDFLDFNHNLYPRFRGEPGAHAKWLKGMNDAAAEVGSSIQYCMALPQHILNSVSLSAITSARVSGDGGRPYTHGGPGQLLTAALGIRPFKDNVWTNGSFPKGWADVVGSVITMGPVGLADKVGATNADLAAAASTVGGTLLHPSRPATPIDATFFPGFSGSVMTTYSKPKRADDSFPNWYIVVVTGTTYELAPSDLWPLPDTNSDMFWWKAASPDQTTSCTAKGATSDQCISPFHANGSLPASASSNDIGIFHIAPVVSGWVVLGEVKKVVPVSAARVQYIKSVDESCDESSIEVGVTGDAGEEVTFAFANIGGHVTVETIVIDRYGNATFNVR